MSGNKIKKTAMCRNSNQPGVHSQLLRGRRLRSVKTRGVKQEPLEMTSEPMDAENSYNVQTHRPASAVAPVEKTNSRAEPPQGSAASNPTDMSLSKRRLSAINLKKRNHECDDEEEEYLSYFSPASYFPNGHGDIDGVNQGMAFEEGIPNARQLNAPTDLEDFVDYVSRKTSIEKENVAALVEFPSPGHLEDFASYLARVCGLDEIKLRDSLSDSPFVTTEVYNSL